MRRQTTLWGFQWLICLEVDDGNFHHRPQPLFVETSRHRIRPLDAWLPLGHISPEIMQIFVIIKTSEKRKKREDERILKGAKVRACKALLEASFINQLEALESEKQQQPRADEREKTFCVVKGSTQRWELFFYAPARDVLVLTRLARILFTRAQQTRASIISPS